MKRKEGHKTAYCLLCDRRFRYYDDKEEDHLNFQKHINTHSKEEIINSLIGKEIIYPLGNENILTQY